MSALVSALFLLVSLISVHGSTEKFIQVLADTNYSRIDPPRLKETTQIRLGIYINSFSAVSARTMDYRISFYLRMAWQDPRLTFNETDYDGNSEVHLREGLWRRIWRPDVFFRNEKQANSHDVTVDNSLLKVNSTGHVWFVRKYTATLSCPMHLQAYPFDTQQCPLLFESFGYMMSAMYLSWLDHPVDVDPQVALPQFTLQDHILHDCSQNYTAGSFPCLEVRFLMQRNVGFCVMQVFLPTVLVVAASWLSFWFDPSAVTVRGLVGLLTLLSIITQGSATADLLPQVSYLKAIDVWFVVCLLFVFGSLMELAVISVLSRRQRGDDNKSPEGSTGRLTAKIDFICRIAFPATFLVFCVVYFSIYA